MKTSTLIILLGLLLPAITTAQSDETGPAVAKAEQQLAEVAAAEYRRLQQDATLAAPPRETDKNTDARSGVQNHGRRLSTLRARLQEAEQHRIRIRYQQARLALIAKTDASGAAARNPSTQTMSASTGK